MPETLGQRLEGFVLGPLPRGVEGGERAAVEAAVGRHHHVPAADMLPALGAYSAGRLGHGLAFARPLPNRRASLRAHSLASAPELQKKTWPPAGSPSPTSRSSVRATSGPGSVPNRLDT